MLPVGHELYVSDETCLGLLIEPGHIAHCVTESVPLVVGMNHPEIE